MLRFFDVAGLKLALDVPLIPSSFEPFSIPDIEEGLPDMMVLAFARNDFFPDTTRCKFVDSFVNDAGHVSLWRGEDSYIFDHYYHESSHHHKMCTSRDFSECDIFLDIRDPYLESSISSLVRIAFAQRIIYFGGVTIHASCIVKDGEARLFLGKSGTGKSTHAALWKQVFPDAWLLNDDCPAVRLMPDGLRVFGTPWSGKTACYVQDSAPLRAVVRLHQAPENEWQSLHGVQAWAAVFPSCSLIFQDESLYLQVTRTVNKMAEKASVGELWCRPDTEAVLLCEEKTESI